MAALVSIVVPAYKNADYIAETLDSILAQTYRELEVIVADHASPDGTKDVLERYDDPRLTVVDTPAGGGAPANWNRVSQLATGTYVKLVCGDDLLRPTAIAEQVAALEANQSAVLSACQRDMIDARSQVFARARGLGRLDGLVRGDVAVRATVRSGTNLFGEPMCILMRRDALERAGWWDASKAYYIDAASYARVLALGDLVALRRPLAAFRVSDSQWSVRLAKQQQEQAAEFHAEMALLFPDCVTYRDVKLGNAMAHMQAWKRRAAYAVLRRRMRPTT